jgi:hypothetical protein
MRIELFSGSQGIRTLAPAWQSLTEQVSRKRHFHLVEWCLALAETFEQHNLVPLRCLALVESNSLVAVIPCRFMRIHLGSKSLSAIRLVSDHLENLTARDIVIAPHLVNGEFFSEFSSLLAKVDSRWQVLSLEGLLPDSLAARALEHSVKIPRFKMPGGAWGKIQFISCGRGADPFAHLTKSFKQNLRTANNKLSSACVSFESARTKNDLNGLLPEFLRVESSGWKGQGGTSALKEPITSTFLQRLILHFGSKGDCEICVMRVGGQPIAALFGITANRIWYIFKTGYDETHHRASPGHLILENLLKQIAIDHSFDTVTPYNAPPWFHAWKPDVVLPVSDLHTFRPSSEGSALAQYMGDAVRRSGRPPLFTPP